MSPMRPWVEAVEAGRMPRPVVLVLGGFLSSPPTYRPFAAHLRKRGAADVVIGNIWLMDWLLASARGLGPVVTRSGRALLEASARSDEVALGAPVLVIGHSAGGITARLLTSPEPFAGRKLHGSERIGAIVTLGTPHITGPHTERHAPSQEASEFVNRVVPGPAFEPRIGYLSVASRRTMGRPGGSGKERAAWQVYRALLPDPEAADAAGEIAGDGLVPVACAQLPGTRLIVLEDPHHGHGIGLSWYGAERFLDLWWPDALATWDAALRARLTRPVPVPVGDLSPMPSPRSAAARAG